MARSAFRLLAWLSLGILAPTCGARLLVAQVPRYHVSDTIFVGDAAGDFYSIDVAHRRLYGAGQYVVDLDSKRIVGTIADSTAYGGFVVAPELDRGIVRNGSLFDLRSGDVTAVLPAEGDASLFDPFSGRAFLLGDTVSAIDLRAGKLAGKLYLPGAGESGVADAHGLIYVNMMFKDSMAVINSTALHVVARYTLAPAKDPMGLSIDRAHGRLFVACMGEVVVLDATNGKQVARIPVPGHSDQNAFDPGTGLIFEPGGAGNGMTIIHEDGPNRYSIVQRLMDPAIAAAKVVVDTSTHRAYVPLRTADHVFRYIVLSPTTN